MTDTTQGKTITQRVFSGAPWEKTVGYCRAIRKGNHISVSGNAPVTEDGNVFSPGDAYRQARRCFEIIEQALKKLGTDRRAVVRTRMFVTDISRWNDYGRAHAKFFHDFLPATSMVEIKSLIDPAMLIEVEAEAIFFWRTHDITQIHLSGHNPLSNIPIVLQG